MYEIPCRCGKVKQNYKMNIGPFFINDCCIEAGYDHLGNLKEESKRDDGIDPQVTTSSADGKKTIEQEITQSEEIQQEADKLEIIDDPALDSQEDESEDEVVKEVNDAIIEESKAAGKRAKRNKNKE